MDEPFVERLKVYFTTEVTAADPPTSWWDNAVTSACWRKQKRKWFQWLADAFSLPVLRIAVPVTLVLIVIGVLFGVWGVPGAHNGASAPVPTVPAPISTPHPHPTTSPILTTPRPHSLDVNMATDKPSYLPGEPVTLTFTLTNITGKPLTLDNMPSDVEISHGIYFIRSFDRGNEVISLEPGASTTFSLIWDQRDSGGAAVHPGVFDISTDYITITTKDPLAVVQENYNDVGTVIINYP